MEIKKVRHQALVSGHSSHTRYTVRNGLLCLWCSLFLLLPMVVYGQQPLPTATPDAEGIIYIDVQPNDSLWSIAAQAHLTLDQLLALNGLTANAVIQPGQRLIIGHGTAPATATVEPLPTATLPPPTPRPTQVPPRTAICLLAYYDQDRDGVFDPGEPLRSSIAFTVFNETAVVANYVTDGLSEPYCVEGLSGGAYHITRSIGPNETLTNDGDWAISLGRGDVAQLEFGSYLISPGGTTVTPPATIAPIGVPTQPPPQAVTQPAPTPQTNAPRNTTGFLLVGLVVVTFFVAVIFLMIQRQLSQ